MRAGPGEVVPDAQWEILSVMAGMEKSGKISRNVGSGICTKFQLKFSHQSGEAGSPVVKRKPGSAIY